MHSAKERESTNFIVKVRKMKPSKKDFRNVSHTHKIVTKYERDRNTNWKEDYYGEEEESTE